MRPGKPSSRQPVGFVGVDHSVLALSHQVAQSANGMEPNEVRADFVYGDTLVT